MCKKYCNVLFISLLLLFFGVACSNGESSNSELSDSLSLSATVSDELSQDEPEALMMELGEAEPQAAVDQTPEEAPKEKPASQTKSKAAAPSYGGAKETIYISTYGANGKVWGYVTMSGNTGRGTIHDDNENTLSIKVTRHGGELFGIDQNGREYVFRM